MTPDREDMLKACEMLSDWTLRYRAANPDAISVCLEVESRIDYEQRRACYVAVWVDGGWLEPLEGSSWTTSFAEAAAEAILRLEVALSEEREREES